MNELALFAGAGGGILGGRLLGWRTICAVEIEEYPRSVLLARQDDGILPPFPVWDDICTFDGRPWRGVVDVVSGGFPCQAFSRAAHGRNTAKNLWPEMLRVIGEVQPTYVFAENVDEAAITSAQIDLEEVGYKTVRTKVSAKNVGADHIRERWWLFGNANDGSKLGVSVNAKTSRLQTTGSTFWKTGPGDTRVAHGVAHRVDRLKAAGNGQVPEVVRLAWRILGDGVTP